jgi:carbon-monoxide dehydrogenase medium subunit
VIPAEFDYVAPGSVDEVLQALRDGGEDAKLLAGGHSLLPLMKLRLAAPALLVDLGRVPGLSGIQRSERSGGEGEARDRGRFSLGAMTRHAEVAREAGLGLAARAAHTIADPQVRHRGTIGGTLAHGDPASDMPAILLAMDGSVVARGAGGEREIPAAELFVDYLTTSLGADEVVTEVRFGAFDGYGHGYRKHNRRQEDWAMVAAGALVKRAADGTCEDVRVGLTHMASVPLRATAVEEALRGQPLDPPSIARAAEQAAEGTDPPADLNASEDYKRHVARVLVRRALEDAAGGASS